MPIFKSRAKLDISYIPPKIVCRDKEILLLKTLVNSNGKALISGDTGTGKTLLARYVLKDAVHINCFVNRTEHAILENILSKVRPKFNPAGLSNRRLWEEIPDNITIILDEIDGMNVDDINHFLYTLSRRYEYGRKLRYVAITRDANILKQIIDDPSTWSTFAEKSIIHLKLYTKEEMIKILTSRAEEALHAGTYDTDILSLIADIAMNSEGHMRTGIDLLRNSALLAEQDGKSKIEPEDVRSANLDVWIEGIDIFDKEHMVALLSMAELSLNRVYLNPEELTDYYSMRCKDYNIQPGNLRRIMKKIEMEGLVHIDRNRGYALLVPSYVVLREIEKRLQLF